MKNLNIVQVPISLIHNKFLNRKRVIAFVSIVASGWKGSDYEQLAKFSLYSTHRGNDSIINQYKHLVQQFLDTGYLEQLNGGMFYTRKDDHFGIIYWCEFQKILSFKKDCKLNGSSFNHANVLLLLAHIRAYMDYTGGKPTFYSNLLSRISEQTGLSVRSISQCVDVLEELGIIHSEKLPRYQDRNGCWHSNSRVFVNMRLQGDTPYDWQEETAKSIRWIRTHRTINKEEKYG